MSSKWEKLNRKTIESMKNGEYGKALETAKEALLAAKRQKGKPNLLVALNNLGEICFAMGRATEAIPVFEQALDLSVKKHGLDHLEQTNLLVSLGELHASMGHYAKAEPLLERAVSIQEKKIKRQLGPVVRIDMLGGRLYCPDEKRPC